MGKIKTAITYGADLHTITFLCPTVALFMWKAFLYFLIVTAFKTLCYHIFGLATATHHPRN